MADDKPNPYANNGGPRPKTRADDRRGKPLGEPGRGVKPFEPTDAQREQVKTLAKVVDVPQIATIMGISKATIERHFRAELDLGQAEAVSLVGAGLLRKALKGDGPSMRFFLSTRGKGAYSKRVEVTGADGGPMVSAHADLGKLTDEDLEAYGRLARIAAGLSPDDDGSDTITGLDP
jgi:hypothetical protein